MALRAAELRRLLLRGEASLPLPLAWRGGRQASTSARDDELSAKSAYDVLGVGVTSSSAEIKASFHRLAKETHPDVAAAAASRRFLQILAAYEILSDTQKRAHYDSYLCSQKQVVQKHPRPSQYVYPASSGIPMSRESNVVEWLKWYRLTIDDIVTKKRIASGSGYFDRLESELYSAIHAAYYGPEVESMDLLPDCFEAEERSVYETSELLHLVSGRDLFGIVSLVDSIRELSDACREKLTRSDSESYGITPNVSVNMEKDSKPISPVDVHNKENDDSVSSPSDAYQDIELRICGRVVATATRSLKCNCIDKSDAEDHIHVFLVPNEVVASDEMQRHLHLGTISGLDTTGEEGSCCVYDGCGIKTHVIVKHRTLMVKHMHWYQVGHDVSPCECRCSRARLPPSRYWLFEPRCYMHDTGGWYIETFGRDKKGRTIPSPRQWDGFNEYSEKRLHPAMYLVALAYRSLDLEDARRKKWSIGNFLELRLSHIPVMPCLIGPDDPVFEKCSIVTLAKDIMHLSRNDCRNSLRLFTVLCLLDVGPLVNSFNHADGRNCTVCHKIADHMMPCHQSVAAPFGGDNLVGLLELTFICLAYLILPEENAAPAKFGKTRHEAADAGINILR